MLRGKSQRYDNYDFLFKIIVIGDTGTSKTSIMGRYDHGEYKKVNPTIGVDFISKTLQVENKRVKLQLWDTSGQERFRAITSSYYRSATACVITYDITRHETFEHVAGWIQDVRRAQSNPNIPVYLVGTKLDLVSADASQRAVTEQEVQQLIEQHSTKESPIVFAGEVSAKDELGITAINQVFQDVAEGVCAAVNRDASQDNASDEDSLSELSEVNLHNPWRSTAGKVATAVTGGLLIAVAALAISFLWIPLTAIAVSTLIIMGVCAVVAMGALTVLAAFGADHCCGKPKLADIEDSELPRSSTYSSEFRHAGLYDGSGKDSERLAPRVDSQYHEIGTDGEEFDPSLASAPSSDAPPTSRGRSLRMSGSDDE